MGGIGRVKDLGRLGDVDEHHEIWFPSNRATQGASLLVVIHGTAAGGWSYSDNSAAAARLDHPCSHGFVCVTADFDFDSNASVLAVRGTWGTDESIAGIARVVAAMGAQYGVNTTGICLWGDSAGGASALGYLWRNPTQVAAVQVHQGAVDIEAVRALGNPLINGLCDTAYHNNWAAASATHDPAQNTSLLAPYADRIRCWYTTGDGLVPTQPTIDFTEEVGCARVCMGSGDHGSGDIFSSDESTAWFADRMGI